MNRQLGTRCILSLWSSIRNPLLLTACLLASAVMAAGEANAKDRPPGGAGPIAEIHHLEGTRVGDRVRLEAGGVHVKETHFSWRLDRRPQSSKAKLAKHTSEETSFDADVPGVFVVRLTVRLRNATATTSFQVAVTEPGPLVALNTIDLDAQGRPGIVVGTQRYADPGNGAGLHVLVLDRNTLELQDNSSVLLQSSAIAGMQSNFEALTDGSLVIVALPASAGAIPSSLVTPLNNALGEIGGVLPVKWTLPPASQQCWASNTPVCEGIAWTGSSATQGSFSVIGVPGMAPGNGWYDDAAQRGTTDGPLVGYLTPGTQVGGGANADPYTFVFGADQYVLVDSCVSGGPSACVIGVGSQTFAPQAEVNGVNVVVLDRVTLKLIAHQTVTSTQALFEALGLQPSKPSGHFALNTYNNQSGLFSDRVVVVIQSVGTGALTYDAAQPLLQVIDQLGGTPETIGSAITHVPPRPYALVGVAGNLPWHGTGIESSPVIASTQPGRVRGVLARDRLARYTPSANDPVGFANLGLLPIVYQDPTPWPYAGNCAIQYIANMIGVGAAYPDIRSGYPNLNIDWNSPALDPTRVPYPSSPSCSPFPTQSDYALIQTQLQDEFEWVMEVRDFIQNLQAPFVDTQLSNQVIVTNIADEIANSVKPPPTGDSTLGWLTVFDAVVAIAAAATGDPVIGTIAASGQLGLLFMSNPSSTPGGPGSPADQIHAQADQLSSQLNDQLLAHLAALDRVETLLVSDSGKLQAVGTNLLDNLDWQWSANATSDAANALNASTSQAVYSALLPPTWPVYNLKPDLTHQFSSADVATFGCGFENQEGDGGVTHTFASALPANQVQSLIQLVPGLETLTTEVWTFGKVDPNFNVDGAKATVPSTSLTDSLFSTGPGGAAAYPPAWYRSTYNPPSHVTCGNVKGSNVSHQAPPPVIPPPEAGYTSG